MSITLKTQVILTTSIVISSETVKRFQAERDEARRMDPFKSEALTGQARAIFEAYISDKSDEEVLQMVLRMGFREGFKETLRTELTGDFRAKGYQVAVNFKEPKKK